MIVRHLTQKQRAAIALSREWKVTVYEGSVRSAKTITSIVDWIAYVRSAPPGLLAIIGKTERTTYNNIISPMIQMLGKKRVRYNRGTGEVTMFGRTILVIGANDERASDKIRGVTLAGAYVDEITIIPESFWSMLLSRLSVPGSRLIGTTNPDGPSHWLKKQYLERAAVHLTGTGSIVEEFPEGWASSYDILRLGDVDPDTPGGRMALARLTFVLDDNPTLDADYRRFVRSTYVGLWFKRFILGLWVLAEGAIYDMLDLDPGGRHRVTWDKVPMLTRFWLGIDYGDINPFHAVLIALGVDNRLYVVGEWRYDGRARQKQMEQTEYEAALRTWLDSGAGIPDDHPMSTDGVWPTRVAVDPSAAGFRNVLRNRNWTGLTTPDDKINPVRDGIRNVASLLGGSGRAHLMFVEGAAPVLEDEAQGYVWDEKKAEHGEDAPVKVDDHGPDALRYAVASCRSTWRPWLGLAA